MSADAAAPRLLSTPSNSFSPRAMRVVTLLLVGLAAIGAAVFAALGAWPVAGFLGAEVLLAAWLIARHGRRAGHAVEEVAIEHGRLVVRARDARGRETQTALDPAWARVEHAADGRLLLVSRGVRAEVGRFLAEDERDAFAEALRRLIARHRPGV
jgi:uncharacterized membrane protein